VCDLKFLWEIRTDFRKYISENSWKILDNERTFDYIHLLPYRFSLFETTTLSYLDKR